MRTRRRATIEDLRTAIDCLPKGTRVAMLEGIRGNEIVVGAYSAGGGICPMLAAHRAGGRTNMISFAHAWDRFAFGGAGTGGPRPATTRELRVLETHLEASLLEEDVPDLELAAAIASHRDLVAHPRPPAPKPKPKPSAPRPGDPDRARELRSRPGWSWMRIDRSHDDYERALARLGELERERELV